MPYCLRCGKEVTPEMKYCPACGASLSVTAHHPPARVRERVLKEEADVLGAVSAGAILIILAFTYIRNPIDPTVIADYFESMGKKGAFIKPPQDFLNAAVFFFYAVGVWSFILSGLRIVFQRSIRKALSDLFGGLFSFFIAFLLTRYAAGVFRGQIALAYFIIAIGVLIIANAIIHLFPEK